MSESTANRSDLWGGAAWVALGALVVFESVRMERFESMGATVYTYPGFIPGLIGAVVAFLGLMLMLRGWRARQVAADGAPVANARVLIALLVSLVYCLVLLAHAHFIVATAVFVAVFTYLFSETGSPRARRVLGACASGVITASVVYFVFQDIFLVRLP
jgi:uncharacterized membrane protein YhaH (DUF805 family)